MVADIYLNLDNMDKLKKIRRKNTLLLKKEGSPL